MPQTLKNKLALVTGAGRGIGAATAHLLAERGAKVIICSRNIDELQDVIDTCSVPENIEFKQLDLSHETQIDDLFSYIKYTYGKLDILVNNAGVVYVSPITSFSSEAWDHTFAVNVKAVAICSKYAFMLAPEAGASIVNVSSIAGIRGVDKFPGWSSYVASKFAVIGLTEALASEGKDKHVRVNCIAPGAVDTKMLADCAPHLKTNTLPSDIAKHIVYLAAYSGKLTGSTMEIFSNE